MKLLKVEDIYRRNVLLHISDRIARGEFLFNSDIHEHNTRGSNRINIPHYNLSHTMMSWKYRGQSLWNSLPEQVKTYRNKKQFGKNLYSYYLSMY